MGKLEFARDFRELVVYEKAREVSRVVYHLSKTFPPEEKYALTDQVRRSVRSIGAQIAEAWAKRRYPNHFVSKLSDADGEKNETLHWLITACDSGYLTPDQVDDVEAELKTIGRMLGRMMARAADFKGEDYGRVKEEQPHYGSIDEFFTANTEH